MSSKSGFGQWFDKQGKDTAGHLGASAAAQNGARAPSAGGSSYSFGGLFGGREAQNVKGDVEAKGDGDGEANTESSSFLPSFVRNTGLFGAGAPPPSEWACGMSLTQRIQVGVLLLLGAGFLFMMSLFVFLPMVLLMPSKFATAFSVGSLLFMAAMAMFRGPRTTIMGFLDRDRLLFTGGYLGSLVLTLYATLVSQSYLLIVLAVVAQVAALLWYASSFIPGGTSGMGFMTRMMLSSASSGARGMAGMVVGRG
jgi:hypothetical protein